MVPTALFGLLCLAPLAVMGDDLSWVPKTVPWPAQQCIDANKNYVGECILPKPENFYPPNHVSESTCRSLKCAQPNWNDGRPTLVKLGKPVDGTHCGYLKVCRYGNCITIDADRMPNRTGIETTYECNSRRHATKQIVSNSIVLTRSPSDEQPVRWPMSAKAIP